MKRITVAAALAVTLFISSPAAQAAQGLLAVVNDQPVTSYDVDQQLRLQQLLGQAGTSRKKALNDIINQVVKIAEAKRYRMDASDRDIDQRMGEFAKGLKTDDAGLEGKLKAQGISLDALRQYVAAQISFARLLRFKYKDSVDVKPAEVDAKMGEIKRDLNGRVAKAMADPRMKPVRVISILEVSFPVDAADGTENQVLQSRAIEANEFMSRFKGCGSARAAAAGIFNVKVGKPLDADASKLPAQLREAMEKKGVGGAVGPMRTKGGIQVIAYCGARTVRPPKPNVQLPSRAQVEQAVMSQKFESVEGKYLAQMRKNAIIEYKDASLAQ